MRINSDLNNLKITGDLDQRVSEGWWVYKRTGRERLEVDRIRIPQGALLQRGSKEMLWQLMEYVESRADFYVFKIGEVMACLHDDNGINGGGIKTLIK